MLPAVPRHSGDVLDVVELGDLRRMSESNMVFFLFFTETEKSRN